jgi:tetratricopeptide (TPR) repeat protein
MSRSALLAGSAVFTVAVAAGFMACAQQKGPMSMVETTAAWKALEANDYQGALQHADKVVEEYLGFARRKQAELNKGKVDVPLGQVADPNRKKAIFELGPLNDVAACLFIKGRCYYRLNRPEESRKAFAEAARLPSARVYDPKQDMFWAPALIAARCVKDPSLAEKPSHNWLTSDAWDAFNSDDFPKALELADACVQLHLGGAQAEQARLSARRLQVPSGAVDAVQKEAVHRNGLLNDVATCAFIKGRSLEKLGNRLEAIRAYEVAARLSYGRCWDPQGWFWSPAEAAAGRLEVLQ